MACLPKEMVLKEDALHRPGRIHNSFVTNILRYIVWMHICRGSAHKEWAKIFYFSNAKVREDYDSFLYLLMSANLSYIKKSDYFY